MLMAAARNFALRTSPQVVRVVPRVAATRSFAIGDTLGKKEKVEEDRYIRGLEKEFIEKKQAEAAQKMALEDEKKFEEQIAPVMEEVEIILSKTGDSVSHEALERLAKWKLMTDASSKPQDLSWAA